MTGTTPPPPGHQPDATTGRSVTVRVLYDGAEVHVFAFDTTGIAAVDIAEEAAEAAFTTLNVDHPPGWSHRSMSVGDVVIVGETALLCAACGWDSIPTGQLLDFIATGEEWDG